MTKTLNTRKAAIAIIAPAIAMLALASPAFAADTSAMMEKAAMTETSMTAHSADFVRFNKTLKGAVSVVEENGQTIIRFSDDFKASNGPDLKIFLSPEGLDTVSGANATRGSVNIGRLQRTKGTQEYVVPAGVNLSQFGSVLVHCEQFSVLWGGAALT